MRADVQRHPAAQRLLPSMFRSWQRSQARGVTRELVGSLRDVALRTPSGLHLGRALVHLVDDARLIAYLQRLTRGLFFCETGMRLTEDVAVTPSVGFEAAVGSQQDALRMLAARNIRSTGAGAFRYAWNHVPEDLRTSIWVLEFYECVPFLIVTVGERASAVRSPEE